jgi:hypothetical protein
MQLDVRDSAQVSSYATVRADVGHDGHGLVVLSGIARPEWRIDTDEVVRTTCRVLLHEPADAVEQSTVTVMLASINNDESVFTFAVDEAVVATAGDELVLDTQLAVQGEPSVLHRFSFQIVLLTRVVPTMISGDLTWQTAQFRPSESTPTAAQNAFVIEANAVTVDDTGSGPGTPPPGSPGILPGGVLQLHPILRGEIVSISVGDQNCSASYVIANPPKLQRLRVTVAATGLHGASAAPIGMRPTGEADFTLTPAEPTREHVDFTSFADAGPA